MLLASRLALHLGQRWNRCEAVTDHDLGHLRSIRWSTGRRVNHLGRLTEVLRTNRAWWDHAERFYILASVIIEPVNGAPRDAECLPRPNLDLFAVDSPGQHPGDAVDRLFIMVVAMRRRRQTLRARDRDLKGRDAAMRVFSGDQEADRERPETDSFFGRINVEVDGWLCHVFPRHRDIESYLSSCWRRLLRLQQRSRADQGSAFQNRA